MGRTVYRWRLIREAYGRDPATVPQIWVVFNEIVQFYNRGVRPPDDVIMAICDSNFGYLLQLPDRTTLEKFLLNEINEREE